MVPIVFHNFFENEVNIATNLCHFNNNAQM